VAKTPIWGMSRSDTKGPFALALDNQQNITMFEQEMEGVLTHLRVSKLNEQDRDVAETWIEWLDMVRVYFYSINAM
jgi:hypothetical protein